MKRQAVLHSAAYALLFVFFTFLFTLVNYPSAKLTSQVNRWVLEASDGALTVGSARIKSPLSLGIGGLVLKSYLGPLDLGSGAVRLRPLGLLLGKRGVDVRLENPWLDLNMTIVTSEDGWGLRVRSMELDLSRLPGEFMALPLDMEGKVEGAAELQSGDSAKEIGSGEARIDSGPIEVQGELLDVLGVAPLKISRIFAVATVKDNVVTLGENGIEGDLKASARGVIRISPANYNSSRLDLTVELEPGPGNRERLAPVFSLMGARPGGDGGVKIRVRGTLGRPSVTM